MESFLSVLGLLLGCLLVIAAAVEATLELFRGTLERLGFTFLKGKTSVESAISLAREMGGDANASLAVRLKAVESAMPEISKLKKETGDAFTALKNNLAGVAGVPPADLETQFTAVVAGIKQQMDESERSRVFLLKLISILIGVIFVSATDFNAMEILSEALKDMELKGLASRLAQFDNAIVNNSLGGIAAAAGSNYWHDALDRVRAAKGILNAAK